LLLVVHPPWWCLPSLCCYSGISNMSTLLFGCYFTYLIILEFVIKYAMVHPPWWCLPSLCCYSGISNMSTLLFGCYFTYLIILEFVIKYAMVHRQKKKIWSMKLYVLACWLPFFFHSLPFMLSNFIIVSRTIKTNIYRFDSCSLFFLWLSLVLMSNHPLSGAE
jgi:hypothetical protein